MSSPALCLRSDRSDHSDQDLFQRIADDLVQKGYSIQPMALPPQLTDMLLTHIASMQDERFRDAGIGREQQHMQNTFIRTDAIAWINGETPAGNAWLQWSHKLQTFLNRRLFMGLFSFESHFAHYSPGNFYKRHYDAFKGEANRILSLVVYLNPNWSIEDGGELVLYQDDEDNDGIRVTPNLGTVVVFCSEEFPHEVLPAQRDRYSIAGWFRVNTSTSDRVDPPR